MFRIHMKEAPPRNYREAYVSLEEKQRLGILLEHMFQAGFVMINTCSATLSTPMTETEIDALVIAISEGLAKISPGG